MIMKIKCGECENFDCPIETLMWTAEEGCSREVPDEIADKYYHYMEEVRPFWKTKNKEAVNREYLEIINFLYDYVYCAPIKNKIDKDGKVDDRKKWDNPIAAFNLGTSVPHYEDNDEFSEKLKALF